MGKVLDKKIKKTKKFSDLRSISKIKQKKAQEDIKITVLKEMSNCLFAKFKKATATEEDPDIENMEFSQEIKPMEID